MLEHKFLTSISGIFTEEDSIMILDDLKQDFVTLDPKKTAKTIIDNSVQSVDTPAFRNNLNRSGN